MEDGLEEQDELLNNNLVMNHDDCNAGKFNIEEAAHDSNERSITGSIRAQSVVNRTRTQSVHVPGSDNFSGAVVFVDFTPITMRVKMSTTALLHVDEFGVSFNYLRVWRGNEAALTSLRDDDAKSKFCSPGVKWFREKIIDLTFTLGPTQKRV
ncbi:hypothetical protein TIFTF001_031517 [Ficus carica]|uniref:Uncharacterized protein n=1 Tax=Ficus carica TaxID=3494 RepID=A0AA88E1N3_FICCA|nr:hypothetical protein TIFTF001_031517 [Ficus carica]